jgi:signal transduction histidine kinase
LNRELEAFFAAIAHDLDEPLLSIDGGARTVLDEIGPRLPEGARNLIQELTDSTLRMRTLIRGLLAHSRTLQREIPPPNP